MSIVEARCFFHALKEDRTNEEDSQKRNVGAACSPHGIHRTCGFGTTTAFAASETAESYMISFPRDGTLLRFTPRTHGDTPPKAI